jgi:hypothetical protein
MDFAESYCKAFDCLWSVFAVTMSATQIVEAAHGFQRESWDPQHPMERNDAQLNYITRIEFEARRERQIAVYEHEGKSENEEKKKYNRQVKHFDRKYTVQMAGEQQEALINKYSDAELSKRIPTEELANLSVTEINKRGTVMAMNKNYAKKKADNSKDSK